MLWKLNFSLFGQGFNLLFRMAAKKDVLHYGMGNRCRGKGEYVLFLDYDDTPLEWVEEEIAFLQERFAYELGTAYLFRTKNGIHVVFLEKHDLGRIITMMDITSCDKQYRTIPMLYGRKVWVLRQSEKEGEQIMYLGRKYASSSWVRSGAHALYLSDICKVPDYDLAGGGGLDGADSLIMAYYHVAERNN